MQNMYHRISPIYTNAICFNPSISVTPRPTIAEDQANQRLSAYCCFLLNPQPPEPQGIAVELLRAPTEPDFLTLKGKSN